MQNLNVICDESEDEDRIKAGDLGAVLVYVNKTICLAVVEVLGFTQGTSKLLASVKDDDIYATGQRSTSIMVQILDLVPPDDIQPESEEFSWSWSGNYVQIQKHCKNETAIMQRHFTTQISGALFNALSPEIIYDANDKPMWSISHNNLKETLDEAWDDLNLDPDKILTQIKSLPKVSGPGLPYCTSNKQNPLLCLPDPTPSDSSTPSSTDPKTDLNAKSQVACQLCDKTISLGTMRTHNGKHILLSHHEIPDKINAGIEVSLVSIYTCF